MNIKISKLDVNNEEEIEALFRWNNDEELFHYLTPVRDKEPPVKGTFQDLKDLYFKDPVHADGIYIIYDGTKLIGNFSLQMDPGHLYKKIKGTSWLGLTIGEKEYWGTGAASFAMKFYEEESMRRHANRIELGVFEFNYRAIKFYQKLGYVEIGRIKDFTYWNGRFWEDIRMEKIF